MPTSGHGILPSKPFDKYRLMNDILHPIDSERHPERPQPEIHYRTSWADRLPVAFAHIIGAILISGSVMLGWVMLGTLFRFPVLSLLFDSIFAGSLAVSFFLVLRGIAFLGETLSFRLDDRRLRIQVELFGKAVAFKAVPLRTITGIHRQNSGDYTENITDLLESAVNFILRRRSYVEIEIQKRLSRNPVVSREMHQAYFQPEVDLPTGSRLVIQTTEGMISIPKSTTHFKTYQALEMRLLGQKTTPPPTPPEATKAVDEAQFRVIMPDEYENE
ncbi:MAG: hypothetical protein D6675_04075 [Gemmatimonadetes bacterium]|nr:MAG: hypothetical protein D6675_04075 [Gemmatimonadota bacterium]